MMTDTPSVRLAQQLALVIPAALLGGAYIAQYGFGLPPCEMCWWQRYPHFFALGLALLSFLAPPRWAWIGLAGVAIIVSGAIGGFHAGVEYKWWEGMTACTSMVSTQGDALQNIMNSPLIRCDVAPWSLLGVSLAGWNFLISVSGGCAILWLLVRGKVG